MMTLLLGITLSVQNSYDADYQAAFDKSFRVAFREKSIEGCVASAKKAAAIKIDVAPICACVADQLLATKTVIQLQEKPTDAEVGPLIAQCLKENPPVVGSVK